MKTEVYGATAEMNSRHTQPLDFNITHVNMGQKLIYICMSCPYTSIVNPYFNASIISTKATDSWSRWMWAGRTCQVTCSLGVGDEEVVFLVFEGTPHSGTREDFIHLQQKHSMTCVVQSKGHWFEQLNVDYTCSPNCRLRVMDFNALTIWALVAEGLSRVSNPIPSNSFKRYGTSSTRRALTHTHTH